MLPTLLLAAAGAATVWASDQRDFNDAYGLEHFVTRPELIAPRYLVAKHHPESIAPGYWFVSPYYVTNQRHRAPTNEYIPCQTGALIYDEDGTLVWSASCRFENRNVFDFKPVDINGTQHLSFWLGHQFIGDVDKIPEIDQAGNDIVLNDKYEEVERIHLHGLGLDCHEFTPLSGKNSALITRLWKEETEELSEFGSSQRKILSGGFQEMEFGTQEVLFDWDPSQHNVSLDESYDTVASGSDAGDDAWDYFHINSVDKSMTGDYLISARHTHTLYKISGRDGHIIWRLGGKYSDFEMEDGVRFAWQHHSRMLAENSTHTIVSVFDNGNEEFGRNPDLPQGFTSGKIIILDTASSPMTAKLLRSFKRPDGDITPLGGSVITLGEDPLTSNVLIQWVFPGYMTEYDAENRMVLEAKFQSKGIKSYRAYKSPFVGRPTEPPAFVVQPIGFGGDEVASALYVSWNGATEVTHWEFYSSESRDGPFTLLRTVKKNGFETSWVSPGMVKYAYAQALDKDGNALGQSDIQTIQPAHSLDGKLRVASPLLDSGRIYAAPEPLAPEQPAPEEIPDETLVETKPPAQDSSSQSSSSVAGRASAETFSFVVWGFAAWGVFCVSRHLYERFCGKRKGYMKLEADIESP